MAGVGEGWARWELELPTGWVNRGSSNQTAAMAQTAKNVWNEVAMAIKETARIAICASPTRHFPSRKLPVPGIMKLRNNGTVLGAMLCIAQSKFAKQDAKNAHSIPVPNPIDSLNASSCRE